MKTRMELAKEFILEMEAVIDNMTPLDRQHAKDRARCKALVKKAGKSWPLTKRDEKVGILMALYLATVADKTGVVNAELTAKGRAGDKEAIARWARIAGLVLLLNKEGGVYGSPIKWTVTAPTKEN